MDWSDEHYVKLYTRKTPTRQLWPWQARALHPNLMLVLTKAGVLDIGTINPARAVAVMVELPEDVVSVGLAALLEDGTLELNGGKLVMPKFLEAQEARKTKGAAQRDHREKVRDVARAKMAGLLDPPAINCNQLQPTATLRPRPLPDPDPEKIAGDERPPKPAKPKKAKPEVPPDARFTPLVATLETQAPGYAFEPADAKPLKRLLTAHGPEECALRFARAWRRTGYPLVRSVRELEKHWNHFATDSPVMGQQQSFTGSGAMRAEVGSL